MARKMHFIAVRGEDFFDAANEAGNALAERGIPSDVRGVMRLSDGAMDEGMRVFAEGERRRMNLSETCDGISVIEHHINDYYAPLAQDGEKTLRKLVRLSMAEQAGEFDDWGEMASYAQMRTQIPFSEGLPDYKFWRGWGIAACFDYEGETGVTVAYYGDDPTKDNCPDWYVVAVAV